MNKLRDSAIEELETLIEYAIYDVENDHDGCEDCEEEEFDLCEYHKNQDYTRDFKEFFGQCGYNDRDMTRAEYDQCERAVKTIKDVWELTPTVCMSGKGESWARVGTGLVENIKEYILKEISNE